MVELLDMLCTCVDEEKGTLAFAIGERSEDVFGEVDRSVGEILRVRVVGGQPVAGGGMVTMAGVVEDE